MIRYTYNRQIEPPAHRVVLVVYQSVIDNDYDEPPTRPYATIDL